MNVSIGIVGLPNTGKSTLFNALTKKSVPAENYPFCTIDPSVGIVQVPDERLQVLAGLSHSREIIPSAVEFVDIAGLVKGAADGEGLGNAFLSHIREVSVIAHMVRCFSNKDVIHVDGDLDPVRDIEVIETELLLADVQLIERRLEKLVKDVKKGDAGAAEEDALLRRALVALQQGQWARAAVSEPEELRQLSALGALTAKPVFYIANVGEGTADEQNLERVVAYARERGADVVNICAHTEQDLSQLDAQEASALREELQLGACGIDNVVQAAYKTLNLISYFTTGEKETRAWACQRDAPAPVAARAIHTDFEKNFIRAEVVRYADFVAAGSSAAAREKGLLRTEGKEYRVQDGDVIVFLTG